MSDTTTHLGLPYLLAAQAQKHVTHNEALRLLDAMVQLSVLDRTRTAPPASPVDGNRHLVDSGATGLWAGWDLNIAFWVDGAWIRLVPFAPVHVEQPWRTARSPGDLTIRWMRRSRALVADAWEQVEVPLAEDLESYDVQILDGSTVKRTLTGTTISVLYTAAQQTADWGAPLGPGQTLAIRIYQLSNRLGRGTPASVTLQF